jgi:hypothetical protein
MKRNYNFRAHHAIRKQQYAYRIIKQCWHVRDEDAHMMARRLRDNLAVCSCQMCCNPRHSDWLSSEEKLTIQERKAQISFDFS